MSSSETPPDDGPVGVTEEPTPPRRPAARPGRPGSARNRNVHDRGPGRARPVRRRLAGDGHRLRGRRGRRACRGGGLPATLLLLVGLVLLSIGLVAAAGSQGIERRTRPGLEYRGPSPFLVFAAAVPISLLAVIALSVPLVAVGLDVDGPVAALLSVTIQAIVYVGLVRLLVVDTGALDWRSMGIVALDRRGDRRHRRRGAVGGPGHLRHGDRRPGAARPRSGHPGQPAATDRDDRRLHRVVRGRRARRAVRRGDPVSRVRHDRLGAGHGRQASARRRVAVLRLRACGHRGGLDGGGRARARGRRPLRGGSRSPSRSAGCSSGEARCGLRSACTPRSTGSCSSSPRPIGRF